MQKITQTNRKTKKNTKRKIVPSNTRESDPKSSMISFLRISNLSGKYRVYEIRIFFLLDALEGLNLINYLGPDMAQCKGSL